MYDFLIDIVPRDDSCHSKISKPRAVPKQHRSKIEGGEADVEPGPAQSLFLSEDQIKACMELLRKQIAQEEKLQESWKNGALLRYKIRHAIFISSCVVS